MAEPLSTLRVVGWSLAAFLLLATLGPHLIRYAARAAGWFASRFTWRGAIAIGVALVVAIAHARYRPWPEDGKNVILDLVAATDPAGYTVLFCWSLALPGLAAGMTVLAASGAWRLWISEPGRARRARGLLPSWPTEDPKEPRLVIGELHHPTEGREIQKPSWLVLDERGLYTGLLIVGAVGTGKTSACMHPFARQLFGWKAGDPAKRAAGLVLEVKGDFCHQIRTMLHEAGRGEDYLEIGLGGRWQWNPLATDMDSYSLAYSVAALLNQLFGTGKEPFWQQASTNLVRWIIELHRALPGHWVTLRDVYHCSIDPELLKKRIGAARQHAGLDAAPDAATVSIDHQHLADHTADLADIDWQERGGRAFTPWSEEVQDRLTRLGIPQKHHESPAARGAPRDLVDRVLAVERWYTNDWMALDTKLRTSIVEGISVFLAMFDLPDVARVFCPSPPVSRRDTLAEPIAGPYSTAGSLPVLQALPSLETLIEDGKVLAFNMPAGASPALARAAGVLLKNAWLQALLKRPAAMARYPGRYYRPAVFVCDEYQAFATVGEDDPSGDEKAFALTRQCRCIPILATQSLSSLRSVLRGQDAWRTLIQTLRTRIFLSLSDSSSAALASEMCGKIRRFSASWSFSEQGKAGLSLTSARAGGARGSLGASKSYRETRDPLFHPRAFTRLDNCQAICLPYDGVKSLDATRVYLKPYYLPRDLPYWRARDAGKL